jgi:hypothetical protein
MLARMLLALLVQLRRRQFLGLIGGGAMWSFVARAQRPENMLTIGFLGSLSQSAQSMWTAA